MMFGHQLADRHQKGEDIFYFCFYMLEFLTSEEFSLASISARARFDRSLARWQCRFLANSLSLSLSLLAPRMKSNSSNNSTNNNKVHQSHLMPKCPAQTW